MPCQRRRTEESLRKCAAIHMHLLIRNPIQGHVECTESSGGGEQGRTAVQITKADWHFTTATARIKLKHLYLSI